MKKIFISQPMKGKTNEQIEAERKAIKETLDKDYGTDYEIVDSFFKDAPHDAKPLWFLGKSIELLSTADIAVFAHGWDGARGCRIEHECAVQYGLEVVEM